jgi:hypothetical protein
MTETYKFRKRGNDEQYIHNQKVFVKMREVINEIRKRQYNIFPLYYSKREKILFILSKHGTKANIRSRKMANNRYAYNREVVDQSEYRLVIAYILGCV